MAAMDWVRYRAPYGANKKENSQGLDIQASNTIFITGNLGEINKSFQA